MRQIKWKAAATGLCIAAIAALHGCGGSDDPGAPPTTVITPPETPAGATPMQPASVNILPGPEIFNAAAPRAPQFENTGIWEAESTRVSGAAAYRKGEFLYQDYLYDDRGATTNGSGGTSLLGRAGRYNYPTDVATYFENLADIVEVRLKLTDTATAFRVTFNSMSNPNLVGTTIALGGTAGVLRTVPFGANTVMPADVFLTVRGTVATATDAATGATLGTYVAKNDYDRRQVEVQLPFAIYDPRGNTAVRVGAASGLWSGSGYSVPQVTATFTLPGGAGTNVTNPSAFFNVAFRFNEPNPIGTFKIWRDGEQGTALATNITANGTTTHDISPFSATVDFVKLASKVDDDLVGQPMGRAASGYLNRILSSRFETTQGVANPAAADITIHKSYGCTPTSMRSADGLTSCAPSFSGRLQPYSLYVPVKAPPATGYGIISDMHGGGDNYNRNSVTPERTTYLAEVGTGSLMFIGEARGGRYYWGGQAGADTWEVMADIKRHYKVDDNKIVASGISHGGNGTWKIALSHPDVFAAAMPHVPCVSGGTGYNGTNAPGGTGTFALPMIDSLRNLPVIISAGENDNTCAWNGAMGNSAIRDKLDSLGYKYEFWSFPGMGHQFAMQPCNGISPKPCAYSYMGDFLETMLPLKRVVNPTRVTLSLSDALNEPMFGFEGDHAYWVFGVKIKDASLINAKVDVKSWGFGLNDAVPLDTVKTLNTDYALGQSISYHNYNKWIRNLAEPVATAARDEVDVVATNVSQVIIDGVRAKLSCNAKINLTGDPATKVIIHGCVKGDASLNDVIDCDDVNIARYLIGVKRGGASYDTRVDMNDDGVIDQKDVDALTALAGSVCK